MNLFKDIRTFVLYYWRCFYWLRLCHTGLRLQTLTTQVRIRSGMQQPTLLPAVLWTSQLRARLCSHPRQKQIRIFQCIDQDLGVCTKTKFGRIDNKLGNNIVNRSALVFFDAYLKDKRSSLIRLKEERLFSSFGQDVQSKNIKVTGNQSLAGFSTSNSLPLVSGSIRTTSAAATAKIDTVVSPVANPYLPTRKPISGGAIADIPRPTLQGGIFNI